MSNLNYPKPVRFGLTLNSAAEIDVNNNPYFSYQFAKVNPITREEEHFLPTNRNLNKAFSVPIEISNGEWKLYIKSKEKNAVYVVIPIILLGFFLSIVGGFFAWFIASQPEKLRELVQEKTNQLKASENNYRNTLERISNICVYFLLVQKEI